MYISTKYQINKNRKVHILLACIFLTISLTGCGDSSPETANHNTTENSVQAVLDSQTQTTEVQTTEMQTTEALTTEVQPPTYVPTIEEPDVVEPNSDTEGIDYDLTKMDSNMVYATVYQFMVNPSAYEGKVIKAEGQYHGTYYEENERYYHYCIIADALGCCSQGLEFVWGDGSHVYPDEYPEENATITVVGTFESYHEKSEAYVYVRLNNATLSR